MVQSGPSAEAIRGRSCLLVSPGFSVRHYMGASFFDKAFSVRRGAQRGHTRKRPSQRRV